VSIIEDRVSKRKCEKNVNKLIKTLKRKRKRERERERERERKFIIKLLKYLNKNSVITVSTKLIKEF
jgi:hypothetical protein